VCSPVGPLFRLPSVALRVGSDCTYLSAPAVAGAKWGPWVLWMNCRVHVRSVRLWTGEEAASHRQCTKHTVSVPNTPSVYQKHRQRTKHRQCTGHRQCTRRRQCTKYTVIIPVYYSVPSDFRQGQSQPRTTTSIPTTDHHAALPPAFFSLIYLLTCMIIAR